MPNQRHTGTGDNIAGNQTKIERQVNLGPGSTYIEKVVPAHKFSKELTAKIPKTQQDKIVGREAELADLHQRLFDNKQVLLVNGMGGIGKTTLAQVYTAKYWDEYRHVAWVSQVSKDIINDFVNTEGLLDNLNIHAGGKDAKELFVTTMTELKKMDDQPNLLIIDNAEVSLSNFYDYLPQNPLWHILVTSRQQIPKFDLKELGFLSEDEAVQLFLSHYTIGIITREEVKELVRTVDLHTLTIEILAKTAQTQRTGINKLKNAIKDDLKAHVYIAHRGDKIERVTSYLNFIFHLSQLTSDEMWLLGQFTCLPPEFHRYDLLQELIAPEAASKEDIFSETMEALSAAGWLLKNQATDSYKMHRILADVIKKQQTIALADVAPLIDCVTRKLCIDQTKDNPVDKFPWIPFGKSVLDIFPDSDEAEISKLQNNLALVLQDLGDYEGAKGLLEKALRSDEKNFGPDHPSTARSYSNLATVLQDLGDYEGALELSGKALCIFQKALPQGHPYIKTVSDIYQSIKQLVK
jgi:tetratricopeptide (TPR) repeat protein